MGSLLPIGQRLFSRLNIDTSNQTTVLAKTDSHQEGHVRFKAQVLWVLHAPIFDPRPFQREDGSQAGFKTEGAWFGMRGNTS